MTRSNLDTTRAPGGCRRRNCQAYKLEVHGQASSISFGQHAAVRNGSIGLARTGFRRMWGVSSHDVLRRLDRSSWEVGPLMEETICTDLYCDVSLDSESSQSAALAQLCSMRRCGLVRKPTLDCSPLSFANSMLNTQHFSFYLGQFLHSLFYCFSLILRVSEAQVFFWLTIWGIKSGLLESRQGWSRYLYMSVIDHPELYVTLAAIGQIIIFSKGRKKERIFFEYCLD